MLNRGVQLFDSLCTILYCTVHDCIVLYIHVQYSIVQYDCTVINSAKLSEDKKNQRNNFQRKSQRACTSLHNNVIFNRLINYTKSIK